MSDTVAVGQCWQDMDPRMPNRILRVLQIDNGKATLCRVLFRGLRSTSTVRIKLTRLDGKKFKRVADPALPPVPSTNKETA